MFSAKQDFFLMIVAGIGFTIKGIHLYIIGETKIGEGMYLQPTIVSPLICFFFASIMFICAFLIWKNRIKK